MGTIRDKMTADLELRGFASTTNKEYLQLGRPEVPDILTGEEVERSFQQIASLKHRAILMIAYGAGLRISEACALKMSDLDSKRMLIHVHSGRRCRACCPSCAGCTAGRPRRCVARSATSRSRGVRPAPQLPGPGLRRASQPRDQLEGPRAQRRDDQRVPGRQDLRSDREAAAELDGIDVVPSTIARPGSDCWDVERHPGDGGPVKSWAVY